MRFIGSENFGRETHGPIGVVSNGAIFNADFHRSLPGLWPTTGMIPLFESCVDKNEEDSAIIGPLFLRNFFRL